MVNMEGKLVGINTAILSRSGGNQGIGFAIPSAMIQPILKSILENGKVVRGWLGVGIQGIDADLQQALGLKDRHGALISSVAASGPAAQAGLKRGDVVVEFPMYTRNYVQEGGSIQLGNPRERPDDDRDGEAHP